jgi:hypothetical protein
MVLASELECLSNAEGARTYVKLFPDCSPAGGTAAAFDLAERRHVPLAALEGSYANFMDSARGPMSPLGP